MIKRIIFDIDNTLIDWKEEYNNEVDEALKEFGIPYTDQTAKELNKAISEYEVDHYKLDRDETANFVNKYTGKQYPKELIYRIIERWGECTPESMEQCIIDTLEYLSSKYEMVILTDWYKEPQLNRLKRLKIDSYFSEIYVAENFRRKPFPDGFLQAKGKNLPEECIMIGDWFERDIEGALSVGMKAIWYCPKWEESQRNERNKSEAKSKINEGIKNKEENKVNRERIEYRKIKSLTQLKEIL